MMSNRLNTLVLRCHNSIKTQFFSVLASTTPAQKPEESEQWTSRLKVHRPDELSKLPIYRILDKFGNVQNKEDEPQLGEEKLISMYKCMSQLNVMDKILYESQRQGRISFYMTNYGEEGCQLGSAAALNDFDLIFAQYREAGVLLWRGFSLEDFMNQCYGNYLDTGKGKQMPVHYGSKELHFVTISSPLATQMPQAVGAAYAFKRSKADRCAVCYFGEGAASEGDAHAAFNFAVTLNAPVIFICRNNGYAISTPSREQYGGDGLAGRALGYGMSVLRVDGNDTLAVYKAVAAARSLSLAEHRPVLVEAITYRIGHHSTSDDSSAYRSPEEVNQWQDSNPIERFKRYLISKNYWNEQREKDWNSEAKKRVLDAFNAAEKHQKPDWREMFTDVNGDMPKNLVKQRAALSQHIERYKQHYPLASYKNS